VHDAADEGVADHRPCPRAVQDLGRRQVHRRRRAGEDDLAHDAADDGVADPRRWRDIVTICYNAC
jgi:hypothetical protein